VNLKKRAVCQLNEGGEGLWKAQDQVKSLSVSLQG
jgi:hypothetical protein